MTTDNAGNVFTSAVITVTVDNTDPTLLVVAPNPVNLATGDPATVSATATDDGSGIANVRFDQCAEDSPACVSDSWVLLGVDTGAPYEASWPIPSDGPRLLRVRATDNAGKQKTELVLITVDRIRPSGSLTAPAAGAYLRGAAVVLAATASDTAPGTVNTVTFQRSPAGAGSWADISIDSSAPYSGTLDTTVLGDGLYDLRVFTTDAAGNAEAAPTTIQVRVDNTLPTGAVTAPAAGANVRGTITLTSDSADSGSGVATAQFQRSPAGAGTWTNQAASFDTTAVADGLYDLRVTTTDNAGNASTSTAITIRVDNTLPTGAVTAPAAGANVRGTITLTSDSADSGSGVATAQFQRSPAGAGTWTNQAASFDTTAVADGLYDLRVTTTDNAGNASTSTAITIRVDNTLPTGSITAPANGAEIGVPPVALTSDSADGGGSGVATVVFERSPAGAGSWTATAASWNTASGPDAVADGSYDLRVKTTDNAGNVFTSPVITALVDHTAPTTTASLAPGSPSNAPVTVSFSANDGAGSGVSVISYRVDGGSLQLGAAVVIPAPGDHSNDGSHLVEFFATDEVGNVETLKNVTVVIDTTAPSGSGGDPGDYLRGIANLSYATGATDVSSVQFQFSPAGAGAWSNVGAADISPPYEAAWNTTLVADGPYDLRAVVTDTTGNAANTLLPGLPKTVDNTAPAGSVTAPAGGAYVSGSIAVDANATDGAVPPASGVSAVRFEVKPAGAGAFSVFGTQTAPVVGSTYRQTLATTALADGLAELRAVVTDVAGNETTSALSTVNVDNDAPVVTLDDPGAAIGASVDLTATSSADTTDVTFRYRPVGDLGAGTAIGADATAPFGVTWTTTPAAEQQWELIAVATDGGGNATTSAPRVVLVDRTQPTGSVTAPAVSATVGGPAVALAASAADTGGSGVTRVEWFVSPSGSGGVYSSVAVDTSAPHTGTWDSTSAPDGPAQIRAEATDAAGNVRTTAVVPVTVDSTGPSVTLTDPGAVLSGTVSLGTTTGGGAVRVQFAVSPANAGTWTQIAEDTTAPFGTPFDTSALADGLYDLRAIGFDGLGNPSAASIREDVRLDNTAPQLVSAAPADGSVSTSANQIVLTASEPVTAPGALLDGAAALAPDDLRQPADLRHRRARRRAPRPLGRARGCERHARTVPGGRHDREHAVGRPAAGRAQRHLLRRLDTDRARRPRHGADASERMADAADAAGLHPRPPRRRRPGRQRLRAGDADRRRHRPLGARRHLRDRVQRTDRDRLLEPVGDAGDPRPLAGCFDVADDRAAQRAACRLAARRLHALELGRARLHAAPDLLRPPARRRRTDRAGPSRGRRPRRRADTALDPGNGRERTTRQSDHVRQRRAVPRVRTDRVRGQARGFRRRRHAQLHAGAERCGRQRQRPHRAASRRPGPRGQVGRRGAGSTRRRRLHGRHRPRDHHVRPRRPAPSSSPPASDFAIASSPIDLVVSRADDRAADPVRPLGRRLEEARAEAEDDSRRPDQGLAAGAGDRDAAGREEPAPARLEASGQGGRERGQVAPPREGPPPGHVQADVDRPLRHGDGQPHDRALARQSCRPSRQAGRSRDRARRQDASG